MRNTERSSLIIIAVIALILCVTYFTFINNRNVDKRTFFENYTGIIEKTDKSVKGYWSVYINNKWIYLDMDGACIDTLNVGDSIIKKTGSYTITIKRKDKNFETREYDCNKGYHFY